MGLWFRHTDRRFGFTWESDRQPPARWHDTGEGPVQYLADTPAGAWAEFLRHEEIVDPAELDGVIRRVWAVEIPDDVVADAVAPSLPDDIGRGAPHTYPLCQDEARQLRAAGHRALRVQSAALHDAAGHQSTAAGVIDGPSRPAEVLVVFGSGAAWTGWMCHDRGLPDPGLLDKIRPLYS